MELLLWDIQQEREETILLQVIRWSKKTKQVSDIKYKKHVWDVKFQISSVRYQTWDVKYEILIIIYQVLDVKYKIITIRYKASNIKC